MDIRPNDLPLLVSLNALLQERNVTRAAARLHMTQPALSAQLARLRTLFQDSLLVPSETGRGMVATRRALDLMAPLAEALELLGAAVGPAGDFDPHQSDRTFRIATNDNGVVLHGLRLIHSLLESGAKRMRMSFVMLAPERIVDALEAGEIDLVIGASRVLPAPLISRSLASEHYVMAHRKHHPRGTHAPTLDEYCAAQHVLVSTSGGFNGFVDEILRDHGRTRHVAVSVAQYNLVPAVLTETTLVSTLPARFLAAYADRLDLFELPFATPDFSLSAAWHSRDDADPGHRWLRAQLGL